MYFKKFFFIFVKKFAFIEVSESGPCTFKFFFIFARKIRKNRTIGANSSNFWFLWLKILKIGFLEIKIDVKQKFFGDLFLF